MSKQRKPSLRWKQEPQATGLVAVTQTVRDHELWYGNERVAVLAHWSPGFGKRKYQGYYWYSFENKELGIPHVNSAAASPDWEYHQLKEAKAFVRARILKYIKEVENETSGHSAI